MSTLIDRARGVLLATAAGDALGAGYEFGGPLEDGTAVLMKGGGAFHWAPGEWTDDTSMAVVIARELAAGHPLEDTATLDSICAAWIDWAASAPDVGNQTAAVLGGADSPTAAACRAAAATLHARTGRTAGNGSLMRTAPVALAYLRDGDEEALAQATAAVSALTHADPAAGEACALWCLGIRQAVREGTVDLPGAVARLRELGLLTAERERYWLDVLGEAEAKQPRDFEHNGWVVHALQGAWSAISHADSLRDALERAVRGGRDTDTVAAIAGGLAGALWGAAAVPDEWVEKVHGWPVVDGVATTGAQLVGMAEAIVERVA